MCEEDFTLSPFQTEFVPTCGINNTNLLRHSYAGTLFLAGVSNKHTQPKTIPAKKRYVIEKQTLWYPTHEA